MFVLSRSSSALSRFLLVFWICVESKSRQVRMRNPRQLGRFTSGRYKYANTIAKTSLHPTVSFMKMTTKTSTDNMHTTRQGKAYGQFLQISLVPPNHQGIRPYEWASSPPRNVPSRNPTLKEGERMEKMRSRLVGWASSAADVLTSTPPGFKPTKNG